MKERTFLFFQMCKFVCNGKMVLSCCSSLHFIFSALLTVRTCTYSILGRVCVQSSGSSGIHWTIILRLRCEMTVMASYICFHIISEDIVENPRSPWMILPRGKPKSERKKRKYKQKEAKVDWSQRQWLLHCVDQRDLATAIQTGLWYWASRLHSPLPWQECSSKSKQGELCSLHRWQLVHKCNDCELSLFHRLGIFDGQMQATLHTMQVYCHQGSTVHISPDANANLAMDEVHKAISSQRSCAVLLKSFEKLVHVTSSLTSYNPVQVAYKVNRWTEDVNITATYTTICHLEW